MLFFILEHKEVSFSTGVHSILPLRETHLFFKSHSQIASISYESDVYCSMTMLMDKCQKWWTYHHRKAPLSMGPLKIS